MRVSIKSSTFFQAAAVILSVAALLVSLMISRDRSNRQPASAAQPVQARNRDASTPQETSVRGWNDPVEMINGLQWALDEKDPSEARAEELLANLFKTGSHASALEAAQALERGLHRELVPTAVEAWAKADGQAAWDAVEMLPEHQTEMRLLVLQNWPDAQTGSLENLILGMPEGGVKSAALGELIRKLGQSDPAALSEWLGIHPQETAVMDQAAEFFVFSCDQENRSAEVAAQWAARISSTERRERAFEALAKQRQISPATHAPRLPESGDAD